MELNHLALHVVMGVVLAVVTTEYCLLKQQLFSCNQNHTEDKVLQSDWDNCCSTANQFHESNKSSNNVSGTTSSVWCWGGDHTDRVCHFHNLFYFPDEGQFAFLHGAGSVYVGLPANRFDPTLLEMSSVRNHNVHYFNYMDVMSSKADRLVNNARVISQKSLILHRFHPNNLMHVVHDDLLPLYYTLTSMEPVFGDRSGLFDAEPFPIQLVLMDGMNPGPFRHLYDAFSSVPSLYKDDLSKPVCFTDAVVGISKHTTWYQYGFSEPQGPLRDLSVSAWDILRFGKFLKSRLNITLRENASGTSSQTAVLVTRKSNRLILNEFNLTLALAQTLHMKVISVAMETHTVIDMIRIISTASVLIGMHGSLLSMALFLPRGSLLVELFPYGVNPDHYTPYKTLVSLPGMEIRYVAWRNWDVDRSVMHVNRSWEEGGIVHLGTEEQDRIINSREVPRHLCCRDPEWLFRIYQDTVVDVDAVLELIKLQLHIDNSVSASSSSATEKAAPLPANQASKIFPSFVINIACSFDLTDPVSLAISWNPPTNLAFVEYWSIRYEVWIQEAGVEDYMAWILSKTSHRFSDKSIRQGANYSIWIRCLMDDVIGPFNLQNIICST